MRGWCPPQALGWKTRENTEALCSSTGVLWGDGDGGLASVSSWSLKTDHWFYGLFQSAPDLIALLLPHGAAEAPSLGPDAPGDELYRFEAPELKAASHRLDGAFWPRSGDIGTPDRPVVLLEVQMHAKPGFMHRLFAQTARFLQLNPQVLHLAVVVVVPHRRLKLGPALLPQQLQAFVDGVIWLSLEELGQQVDLDPWLTLLTLPVQPEAELKRSTQQVLERHPELVSAVLTILLERGFPHSPPRKSWCSPAFLPTNCYTPAPPRTF